MTREEALNVLNLYIKSPFLIKHHFATEASMRAIAQYLIDKGNQGINVDEWGLVGLLHDADYELTRDNPQNHTILLAEKIGAHVTPKTMHAIQSHNYKRNGINPESLMDWAITTCDELTGLVIASTLVQPDRKLSNVTPEFVLKRFNERSFSKAVDRQQIQLCEAKLGIVLIDYIKIVLDAMKGISSHLEL